MFQDRLASASRALRRAWRPPTGMAAVATTRLRAAQAGRPPRRGARRVRHRGAALRPDPAQVRRRDHLGRSSRTSTAWKARSARIRSCSSSRRRPIPVLRDRRHRRHSRTSRRRPGAVLAMRQRRVLRPRCSGPSSSGADLVIHSATKYLEGQGRVLAGAICGRQDLVTRPALTSSCAPAGPAISPFNAWICLKGMETLRMRMKRAIARARSRWRSWLETHPAVERVHLPGLEVAPAARARDARSSRRAAPCSRSS